MLADVAIASWCWIGITSTFKKRQFRTTIKVNLELLTDNDILLMVEKGIIGRICHSIYRYRKANNKYMKYCDPNKDLSNLMYWGYNWLVRALSQNSPVDSFETVKECTSNEDFIKNYSKNSDIGHFFKSSCQIDKRFTQNAQCVTIFTGKNENWKM